MECKKCDKKIDTSEDRYIIYKDNKFECLGDRSETYVTDAGIFCSDGCLISYIMGEK